MNQIIIHKGRTTVVAVSIGEDVSADTFKSEIREGRALTTTKIAEWAVTFETDGTDGELLLTLDDALSVGIAQRKGYMDIKRIINGEPTNLFDDPLEVIFKSPITA